VTRSQRHSTVPRGRPPIRGASPPPPRRVANPTPPARKVARIIDEADSSLLDVLDNLLNRGVVVNADLVLALANVDLVYVRLSALLCAADRLLPDENRE
jgi:gas vesicle protein GvpA/GvpJ/GvpM family